MRTDEYLPSSLAHFLKEEAGVSFAECALVAALIAVVCVIALLALNKGA